jgi:predicted dehydrogenase
MEKVKIGVHAVLQAVGAIDGVEEYAEKWGVPETFDNYKDMIQTADIDVVSVCVPNFLHYEVVLEAANNGKHVICEKPLATTVEHGEEMAALCKEKGVKLFYAEDWMFAPALRRVREIIDEGAIGEVLYVKAKECHNGTHSPFAKDKTKCGGGCLIHLSIHAVTFVISIFGSKENPVTEVTGFVNQGSDDNFVHKDNTGEDWGAGMMKFRNGQWGFIEGNYITVGGMDDKIEIYGSEGVIKVDLTFGSNIDVYSRDGYKYCIEKADNTIGWTKPAVDEFYNLGYVEELAYFIDCVRKDEEPKYELSGEMGLACLKVIKAMYESSEKGETVKGEW